MIQLRLVVVLNALGLGLATWGVTMLLGTHNPFLPVVEALVTVSGLGVVAGGTGWIAVLLLIEGTRGRRTSEADRISVRSAAAINLDLHRDRLSIVMKELQDSALDLIERRRELHHLNLHQWHNEHRDETAGEIEATKLYRLAKTDLEIYRLTLPTKFWSPVDSFAETVERSISREVYSTPNDKGVYESLNRDWHNAMQEITDVSLGLSRTEGLPTTEGFGRVPVH